MFVRKGLIGGYYGLLCLERVCVQFDAGGLQVAELSCKLLVSKLDPYLLPCTEQLQVDQTLKLLRKKKIIKKKLEVIGTRKDFLDKTPVAQEIRPTRRFFFPPEDSLTEM